MNIVLSIIGLVLVVGGGITLFVESSSFKKVAILILIAGIGLFMFGNSFKIIPTGYTGVSITLGQVDERSMSNGFNWKKPFVQKVSTINNKLQNMVVVSEKEKIESTIKGKIPIEISGVTVSYYINPEKAVYIYSTVSDVDSLLTLNIVSSAIKATTPNFDTDSVVIRSGVESVILEELQTYVNNKYGENVLDIAQVTIGNISFTDDYNMSISEKNKAAQEAQTQEVLNTQNINKAKADAEVVKTTAEAQAQAEIIKAEAAAQAKVIEAEAESKANELITNSLNDNILREKYISKWDGALPKVSSDAGNLLIDANSFN